MTTTNILLKLNSQDNVAVALKDIPRNQEIILENNKYIIQDEIPTGHKMALVAIPAKSPIIKYGYPIGTTTKTIEPGQWVHTHNLETTLAGIETYQYQPALITPSPTNNDQDAVFHGFLRADGRAGVRNEIWIIPTVGCCNEITAELAKKAVAHFQKQQNIDAIVNFPHPYGCSQMGGDLLTTQKTLAGLVNHPNAGGVLVVGLGCENNNIPEFKKVLGRYDENRVKFLNLQDVTDEFSAGLKLIEELIAQATQTKRTPIPISKLVIGLKCGGSDAFSGITANPLLGEITDRLVGAGGSALLTEVPEMFGAETILMNRAINSQVFHKIVRLINNFKKYFMKYDQVIYDNPSPGNKKGGITTLNEKSLGCIRKAGLSNIVDVLELGEQLKTSGLNLLNGPGNDIVAITNLAASGAQIILFTTGRGTPLGGVAPTIKISSNSKLAEQKNNWIDFDAGRLLTGTDMPELTQKLWDYLLKVANGNIFTKNEINNYRQIAIFKDGVTL